ncbi:MAG: PASTA domain-containing protein, partial [Catenulispora sp.]|nr:PASTA domain-containing protein [Catenulispora sp.]
KTGRGRRRRGPSRGVIALLVVLAVAATIGVVAWRLGAGQSATVPLVVNDAQAAAEKKIRNAGLKFQVRQEFNETVPAGSVIATDPQGGRKVDKGKTVVLTVSLGQERYGVPNVVGQPLGQAQQALTTAKLTPGKVTQVDDASDPGMVVSLSRPPGTMLQSGTTVDITVSRGLPMAVPVLTGRTEQEARDLLGPKINLVVDPVQIFSDVPLGRIAAQNPAVGAVYPGATITVQISKGPDMVPVPKVDGMSEADARRTLGEAGFQVDAQKPFLVGDKVTRMVPGGGNLAPRGSTVTIELGLF